MNLRLKALLAAGVLLTAPCAMADTVQTFYFDFGPNNVAGRGETTPTDAPDAKGNYWNNVHSTSGNYVTAGAVFADIHNSQGASADGVAVTVNGQFTTNGLAGGGGLMAPEASLLGDLAVASATCDYMFLDGNNADNRPFTISGLDPAHAYTFHIFTSRAANDRRVGRFTIEGYNSFAGENQAAGSGIGAGGENYNNSVVLVSDPVFPDAGGNIRITVSRVAGAYIPLNCMKMVEAEGVKRPDVSAASRRYYFDFGATAQGANKCEVTASPDLNGNHWNNITNTADGSKYADAGSVFASLTDSEGKPCTMTVTLNDRFSTNGMSGGGGLLEPDASLLGDLAIATATSDYYYYEADQADCSMTIGGLEASKAYRFHIFASRAASDNRTGTYRLSGYNMWSGDLQAAGSGIGGSGVNQNVASVLVSDYVFADADGCVKLTVARRSGTYIPLNCMKIEEFDGVERPVLRHYTDLAFGGSAADGRVATVKQLEVDGLAVNTFDCVCDFAAGEFVLTATDEQGAQHIFGRGDTDGTLKAGGAPIAAEALPAIVKVDLDAMRYEITPVSSLRIIGSAVGAWSLDQYKEMHYDGNLVYSWQGELEGHDTSTDSGRVGLYINGSWTAFKRCGTDADHNAILSLDGGADIPINPGSYRFTFDMGSGVLRVDSGDGKLDPYRITVFGSSVANGQGADQIENENHGYMYLYGAGLAERFGSGDSSNPFYVSNISIGGNSTVMLLNRYDDMRREFGKYVVFGVSLGNEGIHDSKDKEATYRQFRDNMLRLIEMVRADGKTPVVCNNYTRGDFTADDYAYILRMDREIGLWDVPSINLLGAIDSKTGRWADGYQNGTDIYHPNQAGHEEFAYAMVPSLFDALHSGKTLTMQRVPAAGAPMQHSRLKATPEGKMHSFSLVLDMASVGAEAQIATVQLAAGKSIVLRASGGRLLASADGREMSVAMPDAAAGFMLALNYTYAASALDMAVATSAGICGSADMRLEQAEPVEFEIGHSDFVLREAMLYRSALSSADVESLAAGELQKGSLEIYSVFGADAAEARAANPENLAMSTNGFVLEADAPDGIEDVCSGETPQAEKYYTIDGLELAEPRPGSVCVAVSARGARKVLF